MPGEIVAHAMTRAEHALTAQLACEPPARAALDIRKHLLARGQQRRQAFGGPDRVGTPGADAAAAAPGIAAGSGAGTKGAEHDGSP